MKLSQRLAVCVLVVGAISCQKGFKVAEGELTTVTAVDKEAQLQTTSQELQSEIKALESEPDRSTTRCLELRKKLQHLVAELKQTSKSMIHTQSQSLLASSEVCESKEVSETTEEINPAIAKIQNRKSQIQSLEEEILQKLKKNTKVSYLYCVSKDQECLEGLTNLNYIAGSEELKGKAFKSILIDSENRSTDVLGRITIKYNDGADATLNFLKAQPAFDQKVADQQKEKDEKISDLKAKIIAKLEGTEVTSVICAVESDLCLKALSQLESIAHDGALRGRATQSILLNSNTSDMSESFTVLISASSTASQMLEVLKRQPHKDSDTVASLLAQKVQIEMLTEQAKKQISNVEIKCLWINQTNCIIGLSNLLYIVGNPEVQGKAYKTIYLSEKTLEMNENFSVALQYNVGAKAMLKTLSAQPSLTRSDAPSIASDRSKEQ
ncbi:MAG: hypothetical protein AB7F59_01980 [Bdellovibrionales bacterium]